MTSLIVPAFEITPRAIELAEQVKLVLFDVDGVLTDGRLILGDDGQEYKAFNSQDGHGIKMLQRNGVTVGIITGRMSRVVEHRVKNLDIKYVFQGCEEKLPVYEGLLSELGLQPHQTAYVGDDVVDLPIMVRVGLAVTVPNAHPLVKRYAHWITPSAGGYGAARQVCELIMHAQGTFSTAMQRYLSTEKEDRRESA